MASSDTEHAAARVAAELIAVLVAVTDGEPRVLTIDDGCALPSGPFASDHRSLQASLRAWVERQTHHPLGYVEQLYTFADRGRGAAEQVVSISYLGLTREARLSGDPHVTWQSWYRYFPWEDRRDPDAALPATLAAALQAWADAAPDAMLRWERRSRVAINFGLESKAWNEELVLQRYETLWEAGLVPESAAASTPDAATSGAAILPTPGTAMLPTPGTAMLPTPGAAMLPTPGAAILPTPGAAILPTPGAAMLHDHRRILATGIARLRGKIKYRPVVFELMPPAFTLGRLQAAMEALAGRRLHKQNFRRVVEQQELVEETGGMATETGGRPAKLFRFRREVVAERAAAGSKLPLAR